MAKLNSLWIDQFTPEKEHSTERTPLSEQLRQLSTHELGAIWVAVRRVFESVDGGDNPKHAFGSNGLALLSEFIVRPADCFHEALIAELKSRIAKARPAVF